MLIEDISISSLSKLYINFKIMYVKYDRLDKLTCVGFLTLKQ